MTVEVRRETKWFGIPLERRRTLQRGESVEFSYIDPLDRAKKRSSFRSPKRQMKATALVGDNLAIVGVSPRIRAKVVTRERLKDGYRVPGNLPGTRFSFGVSK